jgi:GT2 family glycosyltransferase
MAVGGKVSVIVLMHNNVAMTQDCLEHLAQALEGLDHEVLLLDNASTEDSSPMGACGSMFHCYQILRFRENLAFSRVNNLGAIEAVGDWLLFLNNDVMVDRDSVGELLAPMCEDADIGIAGARLLFPGRTRVQHAGIGHMLWGIPSNYGVGASPEDPRVSSSCERFAVTGAMICLPQRVFRKLGGFDERYVWGVEDVDLCLRVRAANKRVLYVPRATGIHPESVTLKVTKLWETPQNHKVYRQTWDSLLIPLEEKYIRDLKAQGIGTVAVFGTGIAARGLTAMLDKNGIGIAAFTSSITKSRGEFFLGRPVVPLESLGEESYDRLIVASQFFFEVESAIHVRDPLQAPIYPLLI